MKSSTMDTHMGNITIDKEVIGQYAGGVAMECFGIVGMAGLNMKDGFVKLLKLENAGRGISVTMHDNKLSFDFHIIVAYGVSVLAVANNLMDSVKYKIEEFTGIPVDKINIYVEGVRVVD